VLLFKFLLQIRPRSLDFYAMNGDLLVFAVEERKSDCSQKISWRNFCQQAKERCALERTGIPIKWQKQQSILLTLDFNEAEMQGDYKIKEYCIAAHIRFAGKTNYDERILFYTGG